MTKLSSKLKEEFFALLPPTIFFFVALHIVMFIRVLMLEGTGLAPSSSVSIAVASLIHYLERLIDFWRQAGGLVAGNEKLLAEIVWPHFWAIQIILFVLIVMYCMMHELVRVIGKEKALRIFFGPMPAPEV